MIEFDISKILRRKLQNIAKKDKVLAKIFYKKVNEIISRDMKTINSYKNLKAPKNDLKRIHLTDNFILLFRVYEDHIFFVDILHWDKAYK